MLPTKQWVYPGPESHIRDSLQNKILVIHNKWIFKKIIYNWPRQDNDCSHAYAQVFGPSVINLESPSRMSIQMDYVNEESQNVTPVLDNPVPEC